jgi:hypothetical protein
MVEGLMQATGARSINRCATLINMTHGVLDRWVAKPELSDPRIRTLVRISAVSRVPLRVIIDWLIMPHGEVLGRISKAGWDEKC